MNHVLISSRWSRGSHGSLILSARSAERPPRFVEEEWVTAKQIECAADTKEIEHLVNLATIKLLKKFARLLERNL